MSRLSKILFSLLLVFIAGIMLIRLFIYLWFGRPLPRVSGEMKLEGLSESAEVYRDGYSVPHILAGKDQDAWMLQGFLTAQDRFFQMDFWRHLTQAQLSLMMGPEAARTDSFMARFNLAGLTGSIEKEMSGESRAVYMAYAGGVNAYLKKNRNRLPVEYRVIRYHPEPWTVRDCLTVYMGYALFTDMSDFRPVLISAIGRKIRTEGFFTDPADRKFRFGPGGSTAERFLGLLDSVRSQGYLPQGFFYVQSRAVPESLSLSGRPILMIGLSADNALPCLYYEMDIKSPSMNVSGFTLPGFPSILFGTNEAVAWGGDRDERLQSFKIGEKDESEAAADSLLFRWMDFRDPGEIFFRVNRCASREVAGRLLGRLSAPKLRWVCADTDEVTACVYDPDFNGGPEKDLNIPSDFYMSDWIRQRFGQMISEDSVSVMDCQSIQTDNYSVFAGRMLPIMLEMLSGSVDSTFQFWMRKFRAWDMNMRIGDAEAAVFETWMRRAACHLWQKDLNPLLFRSLMASPSVWQPALFHTWDYAGKNRGTGYPATPETLHRICETSLLEALKEVEEQQGGSNSSWSWGKMHAVTYRHILSRHSSFQISQSMGLTQPFVLGPYALDGSSSTLSGMVSSVKPFEMCGSMARMIVDLDRPDNTLSILSTGQSGQILDVHYQDQIPLFSRNYYHPNLFDADRIRNAGWLKLTVTPEISP